MKIIQLEKKFIIDKSQLDLLDEMGKEIKKN